MTGRVGRWLRRLLLATGLLLLMLLAGPLAYLAFGDLTQWRGANRDSSGQAPEAATTLAPVIQVYAARTLGWRGAFGVHTWIATKRHAAAGWQVHHVIGWRYYRGGSALVTQGGVPDFHWFGARPDLLLDRRGDDVEALIDQIEAAVQSYPYADLYRVWPGPNSNTFTAWVARAVPALGLDLPPHALGKDYLWAGPALARAPSGSGWQVSMAGMLGLTVAAREGVEINLLGLSGGFDVDDLAWRLPGLGRVPLWPAN